MWPNIPGDMAWRRAYPGVFYPRNPSTNNGVMRHICNLILSAVGVQHNTCDAAEEREVRQVVRAGRDGRVRVGRQRSVAVLAQKQSCAADMYQYQRTCERNIMITPFGTIRAQNETAACSFCPALPIPSTSPLGQPWRTPVLWHFTGISRPLRSEDHRKQAAGKVLVRHKCQEARCVGIDRVSVAKQVARAAHRGRC